MNTEAILAAIDIEISKLQQARAMLGDNPNPFVEKRKVGRPKGVQTANAVKDPKKRVLSEEARAKIAAAQKKRWAASKKSSK